MGIKCVRPHVSPSPPDLPYPPFGRSLVIHTRALLFECPALSSLCCVPPPAYSHVSHENGVQANRNTAKDDDHFQQLAQRLHGMQQRMGGDDAKAGTQQLWFGQGWYSSAKSAVCSYFDALKGWCIGNSGEAPPAPAVAPNGGHTGEPHGSIHMSIPHLYHICTGNPPAAPAPAPAAAPGEVDSFQKQCEPPYDGPKCKGWVARIDAMKARRLRTQVRSNRALS